MSKRTFAREKPTPPKAPAPPLPDPKVELSRRCREWASKSQPDGTLEIIVVDAVKAKVVTALLDSLPTGSGTTGERLATLRRRLERAEGK